MTNAEKFSEKLSRIFKKEYKKQYVKVSNKGSRSFTSDRVRKNICITPLNTCIINNEKNRIK